NADEAYEMGLVHNVIPDSELESFFAELIERLCDNAPLAIANTKTIIEEFVKSEGLPDYARMKQAMERCAKSADYEEGRRAFMEKRKPRFTGK
ncbi:MAG TPA: enoyl-CoA hydratase-related protein, partial [Burkholderiales bacterium]|nr:enoyl-CoA hydratase-related protein [Burkholderiales bacterium]